LVNQKDAIKIVGAPNVFYFTGDMLIVLSSPLTNLIMKKVLFLLFCIALISCRQPAHLQKADPASQGLSATRLARIDTLLTESIDKGYFAGAVAFIARNDKAVYEKAFGFSDLISKTPMTTDAIFRIASQTKAITSTAIMILFEQGKLLLDDPVSLYIPEFANTQVVATYNPSDTSYTAVPAIREPTIRDLLTHTSGIDYAVIGSEQMRAIYAKAGIPVGFENRPLVLGDYMKKLATLPLVHQPGESFTYGLNSDVLGYIVEIVSGQPFDKFLRDNLFVPLDMKDTYFYLPAEKHSRLVAVSTENEEHLVVPMAEPVSAGVNVNYPLVEGTYFSGGAGLSSTIRDYASFLQMLLNGGVYNGKRILSRRTVDLMTSNQIGDLMVGNDKFGLGFEITTEKGQSILGVSVGSFAWGGFFGTTYWADPKEKMVCLLFLQQFPLSHGDAESKFKALVYASLDD
jgi:CubicO group peptidase (beta-lactamase class C family)